jgi:hypothetical protein
VHGPERRSLVGRPWRRPEHWALVLLLLLYLVLAIGSARQKSVTVDELGHLPSGVYFLSTGDARYAALNPPLVNALSALPVLLMDLERPLEPPEASDDPFSFWDNGYHFQERHRGDYLRIFARARLVPIALVGSVALLLFVWARRLAPEAPELAGLLAAGLFCLSPNVIAHARLVGTDTGCALFVTLALFSLRGMLSNPAPLPTLLCGVALGLAQLTKLHALLLLPLFPLVAVSWHLLSPPPRPRLGRLLGCLAAAMLVGLLVLNTGHLWRELGPSLSQLPLQSPDLVVWQDRWLGSLPLPLPGAYLRGLDGQLVEVASAIPSHLFGESFEGGRWYFYLALMAVKTPLSLGLAFGLGIAVSLPRPRLPAREAFLLLAYPVLLFVLLSVSSGRQLGTRALLPAVPLVWLFVAASVGRAGPALWPRLLAIAALLGTLVTSVLAYPDYLSYFNAFAGGSRHGHRYASEANVDIGQDLVKLARYLEDEAAGRVQLLYFGSVDPALYGIDFEVPEGRLEPGLLAVSVSLYHMSYPMYDRGVLKRVGPVEGVGRWDPIAQIGGSIHVYRIGR